MKSGTVRARQATPRPIHAHVAIRLGARRDAAYRALASEISYVWQRGYARNRERFFRIEWRTASVPPTGLGEIEGPTFLWFNFCKYRLCQSLDESLERHLGIRAATEIAYWASEAEDVQQWIFERNTPLALRIVRRFHVGWEYEEWVSEAKYALLRAVQRFDGGRGLRFSGYAFPAVLRSLQRFWCKRQRRRGREIASDAAQDVNYRDRQVEKRDSESHISHVIHSFLENGTLTAQERAVIVARFGLDRAPLTLEAIGEMMGISREWVRQVERTALVKLREAIESSEIRNDLDI